MSLRILLLPFSLLYGIVIFFRNKFYDWGIFSEKRFNIPVISVGNLTTGGTGKTPHIEYLIKILFGKNVAVLSRGYGRIKKGYISVEKKSSASEVGDEPLQLKNKFNEVFVAVCESRKKGIEKILAENSETKVILLDDAFQHRAVNSSLSILVLEYSKIFKSDFLLPAGNLREPFSARERADVIVVSKCPSALVEEDRKKIQGKLELFENQKLFFSFLKYEKIKSVSGDNEIDLQKNVSVVLVTGIADASEIKKYVAENGNLAAHFEFGDHHIFSESEINSIVKKISTIVGENKLILTTEKDAMRLKDITALKNSPLYYLPVEVQFYGNEREEFNKLILEHVGKN